MTLKKLSSTALTAAILFGAATVTALAQNNGPLLDILVRKGILTDQESEEIRAELIRENNASKTTVVIPGGKNTTKLSFSGRIQAQYVGLSTDVEGGNNPASVSHFTLRRVYIGAKAELGSDWMGQVTYDLAGSSFDAAFIQYKGIRDITIDAGLRKVNFAYEERMSSGSLKAIERSGVTRYFAEDNNGRRLGAASYRVGLFLDGKAGNFFYGAAITNPERVSDASSLGDAGNNSPAYWANAGFKGKLGENGSLTLGIGAGHLPDQGGPNVGSGNDLSVASVYGDLSMVKFNLMAEFLYAKDEQGARNGEDAKPCGFYIQPSFMITKKLEAVARYSHLDTDGRGVRISDGVRSAEASGTNFNKLDEIYVGLNYYFFKNDLKISAGYVYGKAKSPLGGGLVSSEKSQGIRTQIQINF